MIEAAHLRVPLKVDAELYVDGRWNGPSAKLKRENGQWVLIYDNKNLTAGALTELIMSNQIDKGA
jgi:hypothetical protein